MRKALWWIGGTLVVLVALWWTNRPQPIEVDVITLDRGAVERSVANTRVGAVEACQRGKLSLPIGGQIDRIHVQEGDLVEAGDPLVSLWNADRRAQLLLARAQLLAAEREQDSLCVSAQLNEREAVRIERLARQNLVSSESVEQRRAQADASQLNCEAAGARKAQAEANIALAEATLELTVLRAPFSGQIADITGEVGEFATPSPPGIPTPPTVDILTNDCHYVSAPLDEIDAAEVREGMPVRITMDAYRGQSFPGLVTRVSPYVQDYERQARTVEIRANFEGDERVRLLAGYSADVEVILETRDNVLRLPSEYVLEGNKVMLLEDGELVTREFERGISNWEFTEVVSGLDQSSRIVSSVGDSGVVTGARAVASP